MTRTTAATSRSINEPGKKPRRRLALTIYTCATLSMIQREGGYVSFVICSHLVHSTAPLRPSGPLPAASRCFVYMYRWFKSKIWRSFFRNCGNGKMFFIPNTPDHCQWEQCTLQSLDRASPAQPSTCRLAPGSRCPAGETTLEQSLVSKEVCATL